MPPSLPSPAEPPPPLPRAHAQANAVGRSSKTIREFLEKHHRDDLTRDETIKLAVKSLLEVVQTGAKNVEITVMDGFGKLKVRVAAAPSPAGLLSSSRG